MLDKIMYAEKIWFARLVSVLTNVFSPYRLFQWMFNKKRNFSLANTLEKSTKYEHRTNLFETVTTLHTLHNTDVLIHKLFLLIVRKLYVIVTTSKNTLLSKNFHIQRFTISTIAKQHSTIFFPIRICFF